MHFINCNFYEIFDNVFIIYRFAANIEDTFTLLMLGLVFYFGIVFCLFGFLLVTVSVNEKKR